MAEQQQGGMATHVPSTTFGALTQEQDAELGRMIESEHGNCLKATAVRLQLRAGWQPPLVAQWINRTPEQVQGAVKAYQQGGIDHLRRYNLGGPVSQPVSQSDR